MIELAGRIVVSLRVPLQRRGGETPAQEQRIAPGRFRQIGECLRPPEALGHFRIAEGLLRSYQQGGRSRGGRGHEAGHGGPGSRAIVADRRPHEQPRCDRIVGITAQKPFRVAAQRGSILPGWARDAEGAEGTIALQALPGQLRGRRVFHVGRRPVASEQGDAEPRAFQATPAHQHVVRTFRERDGNGLRSRDVARVGRARDHHGPVDAQFQRPGSLDQGEVVSSPRSDGAGGRVVDVAFAGLQLESGIAVGKFEGALESRAGWTAIRGARPVRPVERERPA